MRSFYEQNDYAIKELLNGNELYAQGLLRKNARNNPNCVSLNNLGIYYTQYGIVLKNEKIRSAKKAGLHYLIEAAKYDTDWRNCANIATALLEAGNVSAAYQAYLKSHDLHQDARLLYNMGVCLFRLGDFDKSSILFESLCTDSDIECITKYGGQNPLIINAFCHNKLTKKQSCIRYLQKYRAIWRAEDRFDVFLLRCLCGMYAEALSEYEELLEEWYPTDIVLALLAKCIMHVPAFTIDENKVILPTRRHFWNKLKSNDRSIEQIIGEYNYLPPAICMYQFIV